MLGVLTVLKGNRVLLKAIEKDDLNVLYDIWCDEEVRKYDGLYSTVPSKEIIIKNFGAFILGQKKYLSIINEENIVVGYITYEDVMDLTSTYILGITLGKDFWNKGYGQDSVKTLMKYLFINKVAHRIELEVVDLNKGALRCYEKCGFRIEGKKRERYFYQGNYSDVIIMGILKEEYYNLISNK